MNTTLKRIMHQNKEKAIIKMKGNSIMEEIAGEYT